MGGPEPVVGTPPKVPLRVQVVAGGRPLEGAEVIVKGKGKPKTLGTGGLTGPDGQADFGPVDPRTLFEITVRKPNFGPPITPFKPGDNVVKRRARKNGTIDVPLTANASLLRVRVVDSKGKAIPGATVGIDGAAPLPPTDSDGFCPLTAVAPNVQIRFHAKKAGFGPQPSGGAAFQKDAEVVGFATLGPDQVRTETLHLTRFVGKLTIRVETAGPSGVPGPSVIALDDAEVGVDGVTGPGFEKTKNGGKVTIEVPAGKELHIRTHKNGFGKPVTSGDVINLTDVEDDVKPGLKEDEEKEVTLRLVEAPGVGPVITPDTPIVVLVKKTHTKPKRVKINVKSDVKFGGTGILRQENPHGSVRIFNSDTGTDERAFSGKEITLTTKEIEDGTNLFVEADSPTDKVDELKLTLELRGGVKAIRPPVSVTVTCVELTLDICQSRTSATADPTPLSATDKINPGRFVHTQVGTAQGRALLIVRKAKPDAFAGTLVLRANVTGSATAPRIFGAADEVPASGQAALALPLDIASVTAPGNKLFVEGAGVSGALRDIELQLGVKGVDDDGDRVKVTTVEFKSLKATVPTTPPNTVRASNAVTPATQDFQVGAPTLAAADLDEDFLPNTTLVLVENSVPAANPIGLSVQVSPAGVPVRWSARRDTRPAPKGDAPGIKTLTPAPGAQPTVTQQANPLLAQMVADSVGSFHLCAYVDCNGNSTQDFNDATTGARIDREPFILMKVILVRVQGFKDNSQRFPGNRIFTPPAPTSATGVRFQSGLFTAAALAAVHMDAVITVIGGGRQGRDGVDRVFAGWVNNVTGINGVKTWTQVLPAPPGGGPAPPPVTHTETVVFQTQLVAAGTPPQATFFIPPPPPPAPPGLVTVTVAPVPTPFPILDTSPFPSAGTGGNLCVGTEGVAGGALAIVRTNLPAPGHPGASLGQDVRVQMFDSPGFGAATAHTIFPGTLTSFRFDVDFQADLCVWTNMTAVPGATADPACRLYATVQTSRWNVRCQVTFPAGAAAAAPTSSVSLTKDANPTRLATAIAGVEVRLPIALRVFGIDART